MQHNTAATISLQAFLMFFDTKETNTQNMYMDLS